MKPLSGAVGRALSALGLRDDVIRADALRVWPRVSEDTLGVLAHGTRAVRVDGDTLILVAPTTSHAAEIRLREGALIAALHRAAPGTGIRRLRCAPSAEPPGFPRP